MNCVASNTIALIEGQRAVQSNKIDTGTPSENKSLSISGYFSMATRKPDPFISKSKMSIKYNTDLITSDTTLRTTRSKSTMFETPQSFGAEIRYDVNEIFSVGNIFDYSSNSERDDSLVFYDVQNDERGIFSMTFYLRFVANADYILCGYRPEIGLTSVKGDYIVFSDTSKYLSLNNYEDALEYDDFREVDLFFRQAFFIRLFPEMPFSIFGGVQHALIPAHIRYSENSINKIIVDREHVLAAYPGIGLTINKKMYIDFYSTIPLYSSKFRNKSPVSIGFKTQFRFF
jgi:hypothetical protein